MSEKAPFLDKEQSSLTVEQTEKSLEYIISERNRYVERAMERSDYLRLASQVIMDIINDSRAEKLMIPFQSGYSLLSGFNTDNIQATLSFDKGKTIKMHFTKEGFAQSMLQEYYLPEAFDSLSEEKGWLTLNAINAYKNTSLRNMDKEDVYIFKRILFNIMLIRTLGKNAEKAHVINLGDEKRKNIRKIIAKDNVQIKHIDRNKLILLEYRYLSEEPYKIGDEWQTGKLFGTHLPLSQLHSGVKKMLEEEGMLFS